MTKIILAIVLSLGMYSTVYAQSNPNLKEKATIIVDEGQELYQLEKTSWLGTDLFLEKCEDKSNIGGYVSYKDADVTKCIFLSQDDVPNVIGTVSFEKTFDLDKAVVSFEKRDMTNIEKDIYTFRTKALEEINTDTLFKSYSNTSLNIIPIIYKGQKKVYVLTSPKQNNVVLFGNDYLLTFDQKNNLLSKKSLHKSLIPIFFEDSSDKQVIASVHSHLADKDHLITVTDICTLMLYQQFTPWEKHYVVSPEYVSIWNCKTNELDIMSKEAFDKLPNKPLL